MDEKSDPKVIIKQMGVLLEPKNIGKTLASMMPFIGGFVSEAIGQIEGQEVEEKLSSMDAEIKLPKH